MNPNRFTPPPDFDSDRQPSDYRSGFAVANTHPEWTAARWAREVFEGSPTAVRWMLRFGWRTVLLLELAAPGDSTVLGWNLSEADESSATLGAPSRLVDSRNVVRTWPHQVQWATYVTFKRPAARVVWAVIAPVHHWFIPFALRRVAETVGHDEVGLP